MYTPRFRECGTEFKTPTIIEFNFECPHCKKTIFHSISTYIVNDRLAVKCIHCDGMSVIEYYAFPIQDNKEPFDYEVYKAGNGPAEITKSYAVFEDEENEEDEEEEDEE